VTTNNTKYKAMSGLRFRCHLVTFSRRHVVILVILVAAVAGIGYFLWARRVGAEPPPVPAELTDPPARKVIEEKRRAALAAPRSGSAWGELGMAFAAQDIPAEAMVCYRRAIDLDPNDARWPFLLALELNQPGTGGDKEEAVRLYRRSADCPTASTDQWATALLTLADLLTELGRGDEAAPLYQQVFAADPSNQWAAYRVGVALAERDETEKAAQILLGLARNPYAQKKSAIAMAELSRRAGRAKDADGFDYAAGLLPPDHHWPSPFGVELAGLWRGRRALMQRFVEQEAAHEDKATVHTANALADQYPSVETQLLLLRALVNAGDYPAALAVADDILRDENGRKLVTAHSFLGLARLGLADRAEAAGRKADAERLLAQAAEALGESVRLKSDYAPGYFYRAKALLRLGRLPEAEAAARAGVGCRPEEWEGYLVLADVLAAAGRKADAITAAEQAVKLAHPNDPRPKQALEALRHADRGNPEGRK
jgi:tetratricopeptide (TPR) repeat protein